MEGNAMSILDKIVAAVTPPETDYERQLLVEKPLRCLG
jgi:hypothetical protein